MHYFPVLIFFLLVPEASAQQAPCAAQPIKTQIPTANASQHPNRAAIVAALNSPDLAAKKQQFAQQLAKFEADPKVKAQRAQNQKAMNDHVNGAGFQKKKQQMAAQSAAAQSNSAFQKQKAAVLANLKCIAP